MFNGVGRSYGDIGGGFSYGNRDADGDIGVGGVQSSGVYDSYGNDGSSDGGGLGGSDVVLIMAVVMAIVMVVGITTFALARPIKVLVVLVLKTIATFLVVK